MEVVSAQHSRSLASVIYKTAQFTAKPQSGLPGLLATPNVVVESNCKPGPLSFIQPKMATTVFISHASQSVTLGHVRPGVVRVLRAGRDQPERPVRAGEARGTDALDRRRQSFDADRRVADVGP